MIIIELYEDEKEYEILKKNTTKIIEILEKNNYRRIFKDRLNSIFIKNK